MIRHALIVGAQGLSINVGRMRRLPYDYLRDVLVRMDFERDWEKLLPHAWREQFATEVQQRRESAMRELSIVR